MNDFLTVIWNYFEESIVLSLEILIFTDSKPQNIQLMLVFFYCFCYSKYVLLRSINKIIPYSCQIHSLSQETYVLEFGISAQLGTGT